MQAESSSFVSFLISQPVFLNPPMAYAVSTQPESLARELILAKIPPTEDFIAAMVSPEVHGLSSLRRSDADPTHELQRDCGELAKDDRIRVNAARGGHEERLEVWALTHDHKWIRKYGPVVKIHEMMLMAVQEEEGKIQRPCE